jgi:hypothetical protein
MLPGIFVSRVSRRLLIIHVRPSRVAGDATIVGTSITLADNATETLSIGGLGTFTANAGDVLIADAGTVTLGLLAASGTNVTVFEDDAMQIQSIAATGNAQLTSGGAVSDATNARITTQGQSGCNRYRRSHWRTMQRISCMSLAIPCSSQTQVM